MVMVFLPLTMNSLEHNYLVDKNECLEYGTCSQLCNNEDGGYSCECQDGYSLVNSNRPGSKHDCVLKSSGNKIFQLSLKTFMFDQTSLSTNTYYYMHVCYQIISKAF